jgi:hypothetical protein
MAETGRKHNRKTITSRHYARKKCNILKGKKSRCKSNAILAANSISWHNCKGTVICEDLRKTAVPEVIVYGIQSYILSLKSLVLFTNTVL